MTVYCANIAAGFTLASFIKCLRQMPGEPDIQMNLLVAELILGREGELLPFLFQQLFFWAVVLFTDKGGSFH
jgi:hypothetical protein